MVKRKWIYTLPIVILLLFIGCTSRTQVGICLRDTNEGITLPLMQQLTAELKDHGYQVTAVGAVNDQAEQTEQIHHFLDEKYDLLIVEPVITAEAYTVVQQAREANVPVIFLNYEPDPALMNSWEKLCYIGCDRSQPGFMQNDLLESLPDGGDANKDGTVGYLVISGPENHVDAQLWEKTCCTTPQSQCLSIEHGEWNKSSGESITTRCLIKYEDTLDVIICLDDEIALGALEALQAAEKIVGQDIYLLGIGGQWQAVLSVAQEDMTGTVCPDISALTQAAAAAADRLLVGRSVEKRTLLDYVSVTAENAENFM